VINPALASAIKWEKYIPIGWNIRSFDTRIKDKQKLLSRITGQLKPGSIILLHDSMAITAAILPELIKQIKDIKELPYAKHNTGYAMLFNFTLVDKNPKKSIDSTAIKAYVPVRPNSAIKPLSTPRYMLNMVVITAYK
uniref:polysaccharide deacetylase family protein n=1 Tax=uncultured Mucilaginibacter sp. TaxID=797541 RepID=UPI0025CBD307